VQTWSTQLWQEISTENANLIKFMLSHGISKSNMLPRCKESGGFSSFLARFTRPAAPQSVASKKYTPGNEAATSSSAVQNQQGTGVVPSSNNFLGSTQIKNQMVSSGAQINVGQQAVLSDPQILFGVKGPHPA
jgi:hypothetical protein